MPSHWFTDANATITIASLVQEVELLCQKAPACGNPTETEILLADAQKKLDQI
jgi:hypothetical protein